MATNVDITASLLENPVDIDRYLALGHSRGVDPDPNFPFQIKVLSSSSSDIETTTVSLHCKDTNPAPPIRVIFAPTDFPIKSTVEELSELFAHYNFPTAYRVERIQSVTYAFGARETDCWLHFLCKNIQLRRDTSGGYDVFKKSADDHSWNAAGYFLSWSLDEDAEKRRDKKKGKRISGIGRRDLYEDDSEEAEKISNVTLVCSGAPEGLEIRLKTFLAVPRNVEAVMQDPYALWIPVLVESWNMMDDTVWYLQELFGELENTIIRRSKGVSKEDWDAKFEFNFKRLHNLAKHIIHLKEGSDAVLYSLEALQKDHKDHARGEVQEPTKRNFNYTVNLFRSTNVRLSALEKKVGNTINLAFHLVGQQDTRRAKKDSEMFLKDSTSMRVIATVTMIFLPGTTIATIFGSNFFNMSESGKFVKSDDFWIFWIVAVPVSIMTILWWKITLSKKWWKDKMSKIREDGLAGTMKRCENRFLAMVKRGKELQADDGTDGTSTRAKSDSV